MRHRFLNLVNERWLATPRLREFVALEGWPDQTLECVAVTNGAPLLEDRLAACRIAGALRMRTTVSVLALLLAMMGLAAAQELSDYISIKDGFKITFPAEPKVTETT